MKEILGYGQGYAWTLGRKCSVGHDVALKWFYISDAGILTAAAAVGSTLIIGFRFQCDAEPLDARRIACFIEPHTRYPYARVISFRDQPREQVEMTVGSANGSRIQNAFHFIGIAWLRLHHHSQALQLESTHRISSRAHAHLSPKQAMIVLMARLVSSGPLTGIDTTPACSAG